MKAPDFWQREGSWQAALLSPFGSLYRLGGRLRRVCASSYTAKVPVICVGNIVAGGAGKTPTALALAALLKRQGAKPAFVTRGYGGCMAGPLRVDPVRHTFCDVGDEALLLAEAAPCWVARHRAAGVRAAEREASHIILDDGLQNSTVAPSFSFLVIDGETGFGNGGVIPAGPLRETLEDVLPRVNAVIMIGEDRCGLRERMGCSVLRALLRVCLPDDFPKEKSYFAFAGIGRPEKFFASCRAAGLRLAGTQSFPDHYVYSTGDLDSLAARTRRDDARLITTAKDFVRLPPEFRSQSSVLPVELVFDDEAAMMSLMEDQS